MIDFRSRVHQLASIAKPEERAALTWSAAWFFSLLCGYYMVRPVRETYGLTGDDRLLSMFFWLVFAAMLVAIPIYSWLAARVSRQLLIAIVYRLSSGTMLLLFVGLAYTSRAIPNYLVGCLYVFVGVYNLFVVSAFWSVMADVFDDEQGKRLFGIVAAGGTVGGLAGSLATTASTYLLRAHPATAQIAPLLLLVFAAATLEVCLRCARRLESAIPSRPPQRSGSVDRPMATDQGTGGTVWDGLSAVVRSPYLMGICLFLFCGKICATAVYFGQNQIIPAQIADPADRVSLFGGINFAVQIGALILQLLVVGKLLRSIGVGATLLLLPSGYALGFVALSWSPTLATIVAFEVCQRAFAYGIAEPTKQVLFTVIPREQKYKSKGFIDTVIVRGGDSASAQCLRWLLARLAISQAALLLLPVSAIWAVVCAYLGHEERRRSQNEDSLREND